MSKKTFLDKYSYMYYFLGLGNINSKVITIGLQEKKDNNDWKIVLENRKPTNDYMIEYGDFFYAESFTQFSGGKTYSYIKNIKSLCDGIGLKDIKTFNTDIEPFPKSNNKELLNIFYDTNEIDNNKMKNDSNWEKRIEKIRELLIGKIVLIGSNYEDNYILNDLGIKKDKYKDIIFNYENSLYIQVDHFSFLEGKILNDTIQYINNNKLFKDFIKKI